MIQSPTLELSLEKFEAHASKFFMNERSSLAGTSGEFLSSPTTEFHQSQPGKKILFDAMEYSFGSGGKRFRPNLIFAVAEELQVGFEKAVNWAFAIEMIHTYSLIHDDLPCMDNDDLRRGKPTCHKKFNEAMALLAGDSLATLPYQLIAECFDYSDAEVRRLSMILSRCSGLSGMILGQALDLNPEKVSSVETILELHRLKTASLMKACAQGIAHLTNQISEAQKNEWARFGERLGLCFQIKDDLLDYSDKDQIGKSIPHLIGIEATEKMLKNFSDECRMILLNLNSKSVYLTQLIQWNLNRKQ